MVLCSSILNCIVLLALCVKVGKFLSSHSDIDGLPVYPLLSKLKSKFIYIKEIFKSSYNDCEAIRARTGNVPILRASEVRTIP